MSENVAPNAAVQKPLSARSPGGQSNLAETVQKQEQVLAKYRETNAQLLAFKQKTEEAIAAKTELLEAERKKTEELVSEAAKQYAESLEVFSAEREEQLRELSAQPLYDAATVEDIMRSIGSLRVQSGELKTEFTIKFASFMDSFYTAKLLATKVPATRLNASTETLKRRLNHLQSLLGKRCDELTAAVTEFSSPAPKLQVSTPTSVEQKVGEDTFDNVRFQRPSPFLANWFSLNAGLLSNY